MKLIFRMPNRPRDELDAAELAMLRDGEHERLAALLRKHGRAGLAGWVLEQIWSFESACAAYLEAGQLLDALRMAIELPRSDTLDHVIGLIERSELDRPDTLDAAVAVLERRGRHAEVARLLTASGADRHRIAQAWIRAGDRFAAALGLADAGLAHQAFDALGPLGSSANAASLALAAELSWTLGDAEGAARHAQASLRRRREQPSTRSLLGRALAALGHDLAAQLVGGEQEHEPRGALPGRYQVTGVLASALAGAAYIGVDRRTLQEVELHTLLAERIEAGTTPDIEVTAAIDRFTRVAQAASALGHPAIRPVLGVDRDVGILVLPRAEGPTLRTSIRPPGMLSAIPRARAKMTFMLDGLASAHARGLVHGGLVPSQIVADALGRPLLGPFGVHWLSGLIATYTAGLEELMAVTAPELRTGGSPTMASDVYALGSLFAALLSGRLGDVDDHDLPSGQREVIDWMCHVDPRARPDARAVLAKLQRRVVDVQEIGLSEASESSGRWQRDAVLDGRGHAGIEVETCSSWSDALLDALCAHAGAFFQPILDRDGRRLVLAPWPEGCKALGSVVDVRAILPAHALAELPDTVARAIEERLRPESLVATASGAWMIALDDLLTR